MAKVRDINESYYSKFTKNENQEFKKVPLNFITQQGKQQNHKIPYWQDEI